MAVSPVAAMMTPAMPGPAILASPVTVANREVPRRSSPGPTRSIRNVCRAGVSTTWTQPVAKDRGTRYQMLIQPASRGIPMARDAQASRAWVRRATRAAWCLATMVPARRENSSIGRHAAASTAARAAGPPYLRCRTSQNRAVKFIIVPARETTCAARYQR